MTITSVVSRAKRVAARRRTELRVRARMLMAAPVLDAVLNLGLNVCGLKEG
jgi:hypothetical protein